MSERYPVLCTEVRACTESAIAGEVFPTGMDIGIGRRATCTNYMNVMEYLREDATKYSRGTRSQKKDFNYKCKGRGCNGEIKLHVKDTTVISSQPCTCERAVANFPEKKKSPGTQVCP